MKIYELKGPRTRGTISLHQTLAGAKSKVNKIACLVYIVKNGKRMPESESTFWQSLGSQWYNDDGYTINEITVEE